MAGQKTDERDVQLGRRIVEQRKRAGLTQRTVAQSFGMSAAQLQKYEKGTNRISAVHLAILSRLTGTPFGEFFSGISQIDDLAVSGFAEPSQKPYSSDSPLTGLAHVVAQHVADNFNDTNRRDVVAAVEVLHRILK